MWNSLIIFIFHFSFAHGVTINLSLFRDFRTKVFSQLDHFSIALAQVLNQPLSCFCRLVAVLESPTQFLDYLQSLQYSDSVDKHETLQDVLKCFFSHVFHDKNVPDFHDNALNCNHGGVESKFFFSQPSQ